MAKESKTVQCYPSDAAVNRMTSLYEAFGWELIGNQQIQEYTGQTSFGDTVTDHYSTYNKLTFSRDKSAVWYEDAARLEREYDSLDGEQDSIINREPVKKKRIASTVMMIIFAILPLLFIGSAIEGAIYGIIIIAVSASLFILCMIYKIVKSNKYKSAIASWHEQYDKKLEELRKQKDECVEKSRKVIADAERQ